MESIIKQAEYQEVKKYPCIKELNDKHGHTIVLFTDRCEGVCLYSTDKENNQVGEHLTIWTEDAFTPFNGEIILKN